VFLCGQGWQECHNDDVVRPKVAPAATHRTCAAPLMTASCVDIAVGLHSLTSTSGVELGFGVCKAAPSHRGGGLPRQQLAQQLSPAGVADLEALFHDTAVVRRLSYSDSRVSELEDLEMFEREACKRPRHAVFDDDDWTDACFSSDDSTSPALKLKLEPSGVTAAQHTPPSSDDDTCSLDDDLTISLGRDVVAASLAAAMHATDANALKHRAAAGGGSCKPVCVLASVASATRRDCHCAVAGADAAGDTALDAMPVDDELAAVFELVVDGEDGALFPDLLDLPPL
jgi:hypothetical protein